MEGFPDAECNTINSRVLNDQGKTYRGTCTYYYISEKRSYLPKGSIII